MHHHINEQDLEQKAPANWKKQGFIFILIGTLGLILSYFLIEDKQHYKMTYLTSFALALSIGLGSLGLILLHSIMRGGWITVVRRIFEGFLKVLPFCFILFIPIFFFLNDIYAWTVHKTPAKNEITQTQKSEKIYHNGRIKVTEKIDAKWAKHLDHVLHSKEPYLNVPFFIIRALLFFGIWAFLAHFFFKHSTQQDRVADNIHTKKMSKFSAVGIFLFGLSLTFASIDWYMSTDYAWFSTIYGVIYFSTSIITALASVILMSIFLQSKGFLKNVNKEHFHDLGKILYAFMIFFTYVAFSQLILIWYADLSEETYWYINRWKYGWGKVSMIMLFTSFCLPLALFMSRHVKRNKKTITIFAVWMLVASYIHLYWNILPNLTYPEPTAFNFHFIDILVPIFMLTCIVGSFFINLSGQFLTAKNDPRLQESLNFHNY